MGNLWSSDETDTSPRNLSVEEANQALSECGFENTKIIAVGAALPSGQGAAEYFCNVEKQSFYATTAFHRDHPEAPLCFNNCLRLAEGQSCSLTYTQ